MTHIPHRRPFSEHNFTGISHRMMSAHSAFSYFRHFQNKRKDVPLF